MPAMCHVESLKGPRAPQWSLFVGGHLAFGHYGCASWMPQTFKRRDDDQADDDQADGDQANDDQAQAHPTQTAEP